MGFNAIFKPGGAAGGVTAPTLEVGLTLGETTGSIDFDIVNNDDDNPAAVEMAFSQSALKADEFDHGTATSPSFAVDPGATREVTFVRGAEAPDYGEDDVVETITGTLADGSTVSTTVTVEGLIVFKTYVGTISGATFQFTMDAVDMTGAMVNSGDDTLLSGGAGDAADYNAAMYNCTVAVESVGGFDGYVHMDATNDYTLAVTLDPLALDLSRVEDRSYIFVWDNVDDIPANRYLTIVNGGAANNAWGWIHTNNNAQFKSQYLWTGSATDLSADNGENDNLAGEAEDFSTTNLTDGNPRRCLMVVSYDHGEGAATIRWKQKGHGVGHTYITDDIGTADSTAGAVDVRWMGWSSLSATGVKWRYLGVIDSVVSSAQFEVMAGLAIT